MKRRETVSHFLELHSAPCESKLTQGTAQRSSQADLAAYPSWIAASGQRE